MVALPVALSARVAPELKSAAARIAPLTVMPEVPASEPAKVVSVPPDTVVAPVKVLGPPRVRVPEPCLLKLKVDPTLFVIAPPKAVSVLPLTLSWMVPDVPEAVMRPPVVLLSPAKEATVVLAWSSSVPPESTTRAVVLGKAPRFPRRRRPPLTVVVPA